MSISPTSFDWDILSALNDLHTRAFERARATCERILAACPDHPHATHLLGLVADHQEAPEEALKLLETSIALKPEEASFHFNQGIVYEKLQRYAEAAEAFSNAIARQPDYLQAHFQLGQAQLKSGQWTSAQEAFEYILDRQPDFELREYLRQSGASEATLWHYQGVLDSAAGQDHTAEEAYQQALRLEPGHAKAQLGLARLYLKQERLQEAGALLEACLKDRPTADSYHLLAQVFSQQKDYAKALLLLSEALQQNPASLALLQSLAENHLYARHPEACLNAFQDVASAKWRDPTFLRAAADAIQKHPDAGFLFRQALTADYQASERLLAELEPESLEAMHCLAFKDFCIQALNDLDAWKAEQPPPESLWGLEDTDSTEAFESVHLALFERASYLRAHQLDQQLPRWPELVRQSTGPVLALPAADCQKIENDFLAYFPPFASADHALSDTALKTLQDFYAHFPLAHVFWKQPYVLQSDLSDGLLHPILWQLALELQAALPQLLQQRWLKSVCLEQLFTAAGTATDYAIQSSTEHLLVRLWLQAQPQQEEVRIFDVRLPAFENKAQTQGLLADQRALQALMGQAKKVYTVKAAANRILVMQGNLLHQHRLIQSAGPPALCLSLIFGPA